jgi:hypothetical protein
MSRLTCRLVSKIKQDNSKCGLRSSPGTTGFRSYHFRPTLDLSEFSVIELVGCTPSGPRHVRGVPSFPMHIMHMVIMCPGAGVGRDRVNPAVGRDRVNHRSWC